MADKAPGVDMRSALREGRSYEEFAEQHVGHKIHVVGPLKDEGCEIAVRVCVTCLMIALRVGRIAFPLHVSHRDCTDPLFSAAGGAVMTESLDLAPIEARDVECREHDWRCRDVDHADRRALLDEVRRLRSELAEVNAGVDFQVRMAYERERPYVEQWRRETGKADTLPDYGDLLHWVIGKNAALAADLARRREHEFASPLDEQGGCGVCHQPMDFQAHAASRLRRLLAQAERYAQLVAYLDPAWGDAVTQSSLDGSVRAFFSRLAYALRAEPEAR